MTEYTEYPAAALQSVLFGLLTALKRIQSEEEGADLHGRTVEEMLINVANWHPEPNVANHLRHEIHSLFIDFPVTSTKGGEE